jgi:hypothetical protein
MMISMSNELNLVHQEMLHQEMLKELIREIMEEFKRS